MNRYLLKVILGLNIFMFPLMADGPLKEDDECAKENLMQHFPAKFVQETVKKFNVPEDQQAAIVSELAAKDKNIVKMVEEKAAAMNPNPLKSPELRPQAVKIFRETMLAEFGAVLKAHGVTDEDQIQKMLEDIQLQKAKQFTMCMEKLHPEIKEKKPAPAPAAQ